MQEKRALIAIVLIFLVYIIFTTVLRPQRRPETAPTVPEETPQEVSRREVIEEPDTAGGRALDLEALDAGARGTAPAGTQGLGAMDVGAIADEAPLTVVAVTTPLYACRFSSRGGVVTSFKLRDYLLNGDEAVELVPETGRLPFAVALLLKTGDHVDLSEVNWKVSRESINLESDGEATLIFELATEGGLMVRKTCKFIGDSYTMGVGIEVTGPGSSQVRAVEFGWQSGMGVTEIHRKSDDLRNFAGLTLTSEGLSKVDRGDFKKRDEIEFAGDIQWSGVKTKYFLAAVIPLGNDPAIARFVGLGEEAIGMVLETERAGPGAQEFMVYAGPLDWSGLKEVGYELDKAVDFGWRWISPLSKLMFRFMLFCHKAIPNYGLVIIVLSLIIKVLFYPLTQKSMKSMKAMQDIQPEIEKLRKDPKYKDKPQDLQKAIMRTYSERGVNPMGGCFPMLLQMPVFIALFQVLSRTIELRRAPFMLWINDLSSPDVIAKLPFSLPFVGDNLSLLPILMGIAMFIQQKMTTKDPKQAAMTYMMPVVFTVLFFRFPSGLVLYWLVNNILTIGHHYLINRAARKPEVLTTGG